jgi:glutathione peroxidase-family protein
MGQRTRTTFYRYLKHKVGPEKIYWNFGTYYLIGRRGKIKAYPPESLENDIAAIRGEMVGS